MRLVLYTGKGGVGKTTTAATTGLCAADRGRRTLVVSADTAHSLGDVLEERLSSEPTELAPNFFAMEVDARAEMARHWGAVREYLISIFRFQGIEAVVAEELALLPGMEELTTLLAVEEYAVRGGFEFTVIDCAPTDSTLRLLTLPDVAHRALRVLLRVQQAIATVVTPLAQNLIPVPLPDAAFFREADALIYKKLRRLHERITGNEASVRMVVTPEKMVIDEARRAYTDLCLFGIPCDAVIFNRALPPEAHDEAFFRDWLRLQEERFGEVQNLFAPLPVLRAPLEADEVTGLAALRAHGAKLFCDDDPTALLSRAPRLRFVGNQTQGYRAELPLPNAERAALEVLKVADELIVTTGARRRAIKLPRRMLRLDLAQAKFEAGVLTVRFAAPSKGQAPASTGQMQSAQSNPALANAPQEAPIPPCTPGAQPTQIRVEREASVPCAAQSNAPRRPEDT